LAAEGTGKPWVSDSETGLDFLYVSDNAATPTFDELYDCAEALGTCELVLEHIPYQRRRPGLALILRSLDDGRTVHRVVVRSSVETAASKIRGRLERSASPDGDR
jgi:hypothetical protein